MRPLIIFGNGQFGQLARHYFNRYGATTVEKEYLKEGDISWGEITNHCDPKNNDFYAAIVYGDLNRTRERFYKEGKAKGYRIKSFISPRAFVDDEAEIKEHCFILEGNVIQYDVKIGENVIMWSGNHAGHGSVIEPNCFISSHVVISGNCRIGRNSFIGVNSTIGDGVTIGEYSWISPGAIITKDVPPHSLVKSVKSEVAPLDEGRLFG